MREIASRFKLDNASAVKNTAVGPVIVPIRPIPTALTPQIVVNRQVKATVANGNDHNGHD